MSDVGTSLYTVNSIARWAALGFPPAGLDDVFACLPTSGLQAVIPHPVPPTQIEDLLARPVVGRRNLFEDPFGVGGVRLPEGAQLFTYPVMYRPPAPVEVALRDGTTVSVAFTEAELALAEEVIVEGFPRTEAQPFVAQAFLTPEVLRVPGWKTWLARRDGVPAAAAVSYDDGASLGVYWLATLPSHRSVGLGAAVMTSILASRPDLPSVLVATKPGLPLYERLGYRTICEGHWYLRH